MNTIINNRIKTLVGLVLGITTLFGLFAFATPASAASQVTCSSAVISAWVDPQGSPTTAWMQWSTSSSFSGGTFSSAPQTYTNYETINVTASNLSEDTTYYYRAKFVNGSRGSWNGNTFSFKTLSCGGGQPPATSLTCKLDYSATPTPHNINKGVKFEVFGGDGSYSWEDDGGFSDFEAGSGNKRNWISWSTSGTKHVSVTSGGQTANCATATIVDNTPATNLTCKLDYNATPAPHNINKGVKFEAFGGNNSYAYIWHTDGGSSAGQFAAQAWPSWSTPGTKHVSVTNNGQTADCTAVTIIDNTPATNLSCTLDSNATPAPHKINKGVKFEAFGGSAPYTWHTDGGSSAGQFAAQAWPSWSTPGTKHVSVTSNGKTVNCTPVTIVDTYVPPQTCQNPAATNYGGPLPCTYDNPPTNYKYKVTASAGQGGSISPSSRTVNSGSTASFTVSPSSGYSVNSVSSSCGGNLSGNTFVTGPVYSNCHVSASFDQNQGQGPIVILNSNSSSVEPGESAVLYWSTINNPTSCVASGGWSGSKSPSGGNQSTGALYSATTFTITCSNSAGTDSASTTVTINNDNNGEGPEVTTEEEDDVEDDSATLNGRVDGNGRTTRAWFEYGTSASNLNRSTSSDTYGSGTTNYETRIYNLNEDTTYYFRAVAENSEGTDRGSILSFRTDEEDNDNDNDRDPEVTTKSATNVSSSEATLNGRVDGNGRTTRAWFEYGTSTSLGYSTARTSYGSGTTNYDRTIYGLMPNTTYYFRAMAENSEGTDRGSILSFFTTGGYVPPINNQPTVVIYADSTNLAYNGATTVRWSAVNATSCIASGGSVGWAGIKSMGPGSFYTGSLTSTRTYTISCSNNYGSSTDSVTVRVRGQVITDPVIPTSYVIINSSVDRNQPIVPTIDNTRPHPGDEINYTVTYQNIGNASITGLTLRLDLPYEVDYMFSNPSNPTRSGNTLIFNLGTLRANAQGVVTVRVRVRDNIPAGTYLNFPAVLSYVDPSGHMQSVNANVSAQIWSEPEKEETVQLGANVFGAGFFPTNIFGWLLLIILILLLVYLAKYIFGQPGQLAPFSKKTTTTTIQH